MHGRARNVPKAAVFAVAILLAVAAPSYAAIDLGQVPSDISVPAKLLCTNHMMLQTSASSGLDYRVPPGGGVITGWRHFAYTTTGEALRLVLYDGNADNNMVRPVAQSDLQDLTPSSLNQFQTRIPVAGGERLGFYGPTGNIWCGTQSTKGLADRALLAVGAPNIGGPPVAFGPVVDQRINVAATLEPDDDNDNFGDETQDSCPIDGAIQVPCAPVIDKGPKKKTSKRKATILFSVPAGLGISFECALDNQDFAPCESPVKLTKLKVRKHKLQVRAKDGAGNVGLPAVQRWRVTD